MRTNNTINEWNRYDDIRQLFELTNSCSPHLSSQAINRLDSILTLIIEGKIDSLEVFRQFNSVEDDGLQLVKQLFNTNTRKDFHIKILHFLANSESVSVQQFVLQHLIAADGLAKYEIACSILMAISQNLDLAQLQDKITPDHVSQGLSKSITDLVWPFKKLKNFEIYLSHSITSIEEMLVSDKLSFYLSSNLIYNFLHNFEYLDKKVSTAIYIYLHKHFKEGKIIKLFNKDEVDRIRSVGTYDAYVFVRLPFSEAIENTDYNNRTQYLYSGIILNIEELLGFRLTLAKHNRLLRWWYKSNNNPKFSFKIKIKKLSIITDGIFMCIGLITCSLLSLDILLLIKKLKTPKLIDCINYLAASTSSSIMKSINSIMAYDEDVYIKVLTNVESICFTVFSIALFITLLMMVLLFIRTIKSQFLSQFLNLSSMFIMLNLVSSIYLSLNLHFSIGILYLMVFIFFDLTLPNSNRVVSIAKRNPVSIHVNA